MWAVFGITAGWIAVGLLATIPFGFIAYRMKQDRVGKGLAKKPAQPLMRIYIAGPMTGFPDLNFPSFHVEARRLRDLGFEVVNPAEIDLDPESKWSDCMRADIRALVTCDAISLLPGWEKSRGATLEHHIAQSLGMAVMLAEPVAEEMAA